MKNINHSRTTEPGNQRNSLLTRNLIASSVIAGASCAAMTTFAADKAPTKKPNIIFIMADDLGWKELGCYGQKKIKTPNIDKMAKDGQMWTQFYSGSAVCAPARCTLMTGKHGGHAVVRDNKEVKNSKPGIFGGQAPMPADEIKFVKALKAQGYATGCFGKWGLGAPGSASDPINSGFDRFYGYNCQRHAHNLYPNYIVDDNKNQPLPGNKNGAQKQYAPQLIADELLKFVRDNKDKPFYIYYPTVLPHLALQVPQKYVDMYKGQWDETPYTGGQGYRRNKTPRATYAGMITFLDEQVGRLMQELKDLGIDDNTLVVFTSDNGTTYLDRQVDFKFFNSVGNLRGLKGSLYEGGIREPMVVRWPGRVAPNTSTDQTGILYDMPATIAEITGISDKIGYTDGLSLLPTFLGKPEQQKQHPFLFWDFAGYGGQLAVRMGKWKGIKRNIKRKPNAPLELYDLEKDVSEKNNVAKQHPEIVKKIEEIMLSERTRPAERRFQFGKYSDDK
jgi:arylsulfatase A-like enzyme